MSTVFRIGDIVRDVLPFHSPHHPKTYKVLNVRRNIHGDELIDVEGQGWRLAKFYKLVPDEFEGLDRTLDI